MSEADTLPASSRPTRPPGIYMTSGDTLVVTMAPLDLVRKAFPIEAFDIARPGYSLVGRKWKRIILLWRPPVTPSSAVRRPRTIASVMEEDWFNHDLRLKFGPGVEVIDLTAVG